MKTFLALITGFSVGYLLLPLFLARKSGILQSTNYKGQPILNSAGVWLSLVLILGASPMLIWYPKLPLFWFFVLSITFIGFIDDLFYEKAKGIKGHLLKLRSKILTTGIIKLVFIFLLSLGLVISLQRELWYLDALLLSLFANTVNTLDTRPGQAMQFFGFIFLSSLFFTKTDTVRILATVLAGSSLALLPYEMKEKTMLGDAGANLLGIVVGLMLWDLTLLYKVTLIILAFIWQLVADNLSLSKFIARIKER